MSHKENIAEQIRICMKSYPGLRAKDIASKLGLTRSVVNSYLYTKRSPALGNEVYQDSNYGWHLTKESLEKEKMPTASFTKRLPITNHLSNSKPDVISAPYTRLDYYTSVRVNLREAFHGVYKTIHNGHDNVTIYIPPYTRPETQICIEGKGLHQGNLYCRIDLEPDDPLKLSGDDILSKITITDVLINQGGEIEVETLDGILKTKLPPNLKSGNHLKISQKGWLNRFNIRGDQYIHVEIIQSNIIKTEPYQLDKAYSLDVVEEVFRDPDYLDLSDNDQAKLAEFLEKARQRQEQKKSLVKSQKSQLLAIITSTSFWIVVTLGGLSIYGGVRFFSEFLLLESIEQPVNDTK